MRRWRHSEVKHSTTLHSLPCLHIQNEFGRNWLHLTLFGSRFSAYNSIYTSLKARSPPSPDENTCLLFHFGKKAFYPQKNFELCGHVAPHSLSHLQVPSKESLHSTYQPGEWVIIPSSWDHTQEERGWSRCWILCMQEMVRSWGTQRPTALLPLNPSHSCSRGARELSLLLSWRSAHPYGPKVSS